MSNAHCGFLSFSERLIGRWGGAAVLAGLMFLLAAPISFAGQKIEQKRPDARTLYLKAATVDTRTRPSLLRDDAEFDADRYYVVQLDGPITPARRAMLQAVHVELGDYLPMNAYVARLGATRADVLTRLGFIAWIGPYQDDWKVSPQFAKRPAQVTFGTGERRSLEADGKRRVAVQLFDIAKASAVEKRLDKSGMKVVKKAAADGAVSLKTVKDAGILAVDVDARRVSSLRTDPDVMFIEEATECAPRNSSTTWILQSNIEDVTPLWDAGLHGEGEIVGLIDWDLDPDHCAFYDDEPFGATHRKLQAYYGLGENPGYGYHGTHVGGVLAGDELADTQPDLKGMAYESRMVFQHYSAVISESNLLRRLATAHEDGARVHSNSWGSTSDSTYNAFARAVDQFCWGYEDDLVVFAIANGTGSQPLLSPENAKNCLAVGACQDAPDQGSHGNGRSGPTLDGRQKPEVWAVGCYVNSAKVDTDCDVQLRYCATSWAAPAASGMGVLVRQYFTNGYYPAGFPLAGAEMVPSGALMKAVLINSAVDMDGFDGYFGPHEGWGRLLLDDALYFEGDSRRLLVQDVRNASGLSTNQADQYYVMVNDVTQPLKITLVWTDAAAAVAAEFTPVNNLDLVVTDPNGVVYYGNVFEGTESITGGAPDILNNAEQVHRNTPAPGPWKIDIVATAVNAGIQGYALVVTGGVPSEFSPCLEADLDGDWDVDTDDYLLFLAAFGRAAGEPGYDARADFDGDGLVNLVDYQRWLACYRDYVGDPLAGPPPPPVPGDINGDGMADGRDVQAFVDVMIHPGEPVTASQLRADLNGNGELDAEDASLFVEQLVGIE